MAFFFSADNSLKDYIWRNVLKNDLKSLEQLASKIENPKEQFQYVDPQAGWSYLHAAAAYDSQKVVDFLIQQGVEVDLIDKQRKTALDIAVQRKKYQIAFILHQKYGASLASDCPIQFRQYVNWKNKQGLAWLQKHLLKDKVMLQLQRGYECPNREKVDQEEVPTESLG